jgi:DNA-binding XRE family transcriptional regulator
LKYIQQNDNIQLQIELYSRKEVITLDKDKIRLERLRKKFSQDELAKAAHVDRTYISMIETGRKTPSLAVLERIAKALNCSIKDFF